MNTSSTKAYDLYLRAWAITARPHERQDLGAGTSREYAAVAVATRDAKKDALRSKSEVEAEINALLGAEQ